MKSLSDQLKEARRELAIRQAAYPNWIQSGRLKPHTAQHQIDCMEAIVETLQKAQYLHEVSNEILTKKEPLSDDEW